MYIRVGAYWFSATSLSKWPPGGHIGFFGFRTNFSLALNINFKLQWRNTYVYGSEPIDFQWLHFLNGCLVAILDFSVSGWHGFGSVTQVCFGISVSNFMCMSFVAVGRSLMIVSYVASKMAALWFWTMFNCNPPIAHCHPLLWGGGILVDHWSTISSWFWNCMITCQNLHFGKYVGLTVCLSVCLSVCLLSVCLSVFCLSVCLSVRLSVCLSLYKITDNSQTIWDIFTKIGPQMYLGCSSIAISFPRSKVKVTRSTQRSN